MEQVDDRIEDEDMEEEEQEEEQKREREEGGVEPPAQGVPAPEASWSR